MGALLYFPIFPASLRQKLKMKYHEYPKTKKMKNKLILEYKVILCNVLFRQGESENYGAGVIGHV